MRVRNFRSLTFIMPRPLFISPVQATKPMRKDRVSLVPSWTGTSMTALKESLKLSGDAFIRFPSAVCTACDVKISGFNLISAISGIWVN